MPNLALQKKKHVSSFRKVAIGTWSTAYDPSVYGTLTVRMEKALLYRDEFRAATGKHITVTGRTPTEVALARLIDAAIDYELTRHGRRHLACHTSWPHVGPLADRPDTRVTRDSVLVPHIGDLTCFNFHTHDNGVTTPRPRR